MLNPKPTSSLHTKRYLTRISKKLLLADLAIVAAQLGKRCISQGDYRRHGRFSLGVYRIRFKTWEQALQQVHCQPVRLARAPVEDIILDFQRVAKKLKTTKLALKDYEIHGCYSTQIVHGRFRLWQDAMAAAGLKPANPRNGPNRPRRGPRHLTVKIRFDILRRDHFKCTACGRSPTSDPTVILEVDHIIPWSAGGASTPENLRTLCKQCNRGKSDSVPTRESTNPPQDTPTHPPLR